MNNILKNNLIHNGLTQQRENPPKGYGRDFHEDWTGFRFVRTDGDKDLRGKELIVTGKTVDSEWDVVLADAYDPSVGPDDYWSVDSFTHEALCEIFAQQLLEDRLNTPPLLTVLDALSEVNTPAQITQPGYEWVVNVISGNMILWIPGSQSSDIILSTEEEVIAWLREHAPEAFASSK